MIIVTSPFHWYHAMTLTSRSNLLPVEGDQNAGNLLVSSKSNKHKRIVIFCAGNNFHLALGQRSRSQHDAIRKVLSHGSGRSMQGMNALSLILQKMWPRLKFKRQTKRQIKVFVPPLCKSARYKKVTVETQT